ncbi:hypothetical protein EYF80_064604 [Liparis tanakae]|uniref:Uncharacterized protein n=1 Tax=Liparis tanakae TaxID=230148 RepID=A0A4Z2E8Y1_9TELE|nr:hypothetical protein EYF80_064604 [Liparis tanakae]
MVVLRSGSPIKGPVEPSPEAPPPSLPCGAVCRTNTAGTGSRYWEREKASIRGHMTPSRGHMTPSRGHMTPSRGHMTRMASS